MPLDAGQVIDGKYVIKRLIAEGGMAEVYLGTNERIGKNVAVKVLHRDVATDPSVIARFEREAQVAALISSAHVTDVLDLGELPTGERFIVMEYLDGESLAARLAREKTIDEPRLSDIARQILDALVAAHAAGVVHRDLKPENVILTRRDRADFVKLVDFGVSKVASAAPSMRSTMSGIVLGTPMYMSPEQARGFNDALDHRTDLYALGVILYEAVSGEPPFTADNLNDLLLRVANEEAPPLERRAKHVSPELLEIVRKAMAKSASARFASADEMREAVLFWQSNVGGAPRVSRTSMSSLGAPAAVPALSVRRFRAKWLALPTAVALGIAVPASFMWRASMTTAPTATPATTAIELGDLAPEMKSMPSATEPPSPPSAASNATTSHGTTASVALPPAASAASARSPRRVAGSRPVHEKETKEEAPPSSLDGGANAEIEDARAASAVEQQRDL